MAKLTRSVDIDAPVESVFDFALDIGKLWGSWPEEIAIREVELTPEGVGSSARIFAHIFAIHLEGTVEYTEVVRNERIVAKAHFPGEKPTWTFTFEPIEGGTRFTAEAEWEVNVPVVGKPYEAMLVKGHEGAIEKLMATVKSRLEEAAVAV